MKITDKEAAMCKHVMGEQEFYAAAPFSVRQLVEAYRMGRRSVRRKKRRVVVETKSLSETDRCNDRVGY